MLNNKVPKRRFKGFTDDWVSKTIKEIGEVITGTTPSTKNKSFYNGEFLFATPGDIDERRYITKTETTLSKKGLLQGRLINSNSILFVCVGSTIGKVAQNKEPLITNQQINSIVPFEKLSAEFIYSLMLKIAPEVKAQAANQAVPIMAKSIFEKFPILIPSSEEQINLGNYFEKLDTLIELQSNKVCKLENLKTSYLEKMFPKNNETVPEYRFKGFTDDWEQRKLGEIAKITIGEFVIKTKQNEKNPYPVYNGGISYTGKYDEYNNKGPKVLISARGANAGFINKVSGYYWAGNSCYSVGVEEISKYDIDYVFHFMKKNQRVFTSNQQAANIPSVSKSDVEKFDIRYPSSEEQEKIGSFFKELDNLITLHQCKLNKLKNLKQAYLNEMFVN